MLTLLRSNQPVATAIVPLTVLVFAVLEYLVPRATAPLPGLYAWLPASLGWLGATWLHYVLIAINALYINALMNRHELSERSHNLTGWFFAFVYSVQPVVAPLDPALVGGVFLLAGLNEMLRVYRQNEVSHHYFNAGFLMGIAAVVAQAYAIAVVVLVASVFYTRALNWREVTLPVIGFALPTVLFGAVLWLFDLPLDRFGYGDENAVFALTRTDIGTSGVIALFVLVALGLFGLTAMLRSFGSSSNKSKNSKAVLLIFALGFTSTVMFFYDEALPVVRYLLIALGAYLFPWPLTGRISTTGKLYFYTALVALLGLFLSLRGWL